MGPARLVRGTVRSRSQHPGRVETEGAGRSGPELPGSADQLIEAVAAANPRTIVVLNTGAPVLMPWLNQVAGLIEGWYPGQDDGAAIARVLFGQVNPSGHLPVTFPASASQTPVSSPQQFPGVNGQVNYSEGVDVGYRWYDQNNVTPLFPFGYGLSYTTFFGLHTCAVYYQQIPVDPSKTIASVTVPNNPLLHLFDIGVPSSASYPSLAAAYDDTGLAPSSLEGNYDGSGYSFDSSGFPFAPGGSVAAQGVQFTWPSYAPGTFDNARAEGQTIGVSGSGSVLGFLGAGGFGTQTGTITITYTDGSTSTASLSFADWYADSAAPGGTVVTTVPWNDAPGSTLGAHQVSIYSATVPLQAGKTVASVTLPTDFNMHIFAVATGT